MSDVKHEFVALPATGRAGWGSHRCQGLYHRPTRGPAPRTAFIASHYNIDFSEHYLAEPLAERGFGFLGWNTRFRGAESYFLLEPALEDIALGARWLRERGVQTLVLLGNSGGGSLMAAYQAHGAGPKGDLYISVAAHPGRPQVFTNWLDPSVIDESDPASTEPALDMYNPENGPPYSPDFVASYRDGQVARNRRITAWAKGELERLRHSGGSDRLFTVHRTWADLRFADPTIDPSDRPTPACYAGDPRRANRGVFGIGTVNTVRTWLSMWSLDDSHCAGEPHLAQIESPSLVVQATQDVGVFPSDAAAILDALAAADKQLVELAGDHYFRSPDGAGETLADLIADWVSDRA
jgi:pimeloyl-ACP methyl ester carboxylesterase